MDLQMDTPASIALDPSDPVLNEQEPALRDPAAIARQRQRAEAAARHCCEAAAISGPLFWPRVGLLATCVCEERKYDMPWLQLMG